MGFDWVYTSTEWKIKAYGGAIKANRTRDYNYQDISDKICQE